MAYGKDTEVPFERSVAEIVALLRGAGADQIGQMEDRASFTIQFALGGRIVKFVVRLLAPDDVEKIRGRRQDPARVEEQWRRQRGRALLLVIKAKLESVESDVETFEQAFLANIVMADGTTLYDRVRQPLALEYRDRKPVLLLGGPA
ncbi:hypothetical protein [Sphingomonas morindae]|uniref:Uncharacterized protein n=1 Tax=Sphingomonas morindae TaxID=1541170 RepID=A0ABY4X427_9SPHN|nr:hypothetical protein [Sphingomonas morindae]USI71646.1 hypothetical protein LHA26_09890 [Sphingomonas morindae]